MFLCSLFWSSQGGQLPPKVSELPAPKYPGEKPGDLKLPLPGTHQCGPSSQAWLNYLSGEGLKEAGVPPCPPAPVGRSFLFPLYFSARGEEGKGWGRGAGREREGARGREGDRENK